MRVQVSNACVLSMAARVYFPTDVPVSSSPLLSLAAMSLAPRTGVVRTRAARATTVAAVPPTAGRATTTSSRAWKRVRRAPVRQYGERYVAYVYPPTVFMSFLHSIPGTFHAVCMLSNYSFYLIALPYVTLPPTLLCILVLVLI